MAVLVVGGDYLGNIPGKLKSFGFTRIIHVSGMKRGDWLIEIPSQVEYIIVLVDYISHGLMGIVKEKTRESGKKTVFARRAWSHIEKALIEGGVEH